MFEPILGKIMDTYIDSIVVKSKEKSDHIRDWTEVFAILKTHKLRRNKVCLRGELRKVLGTFNDKARYRSEPRTNHSDQQPRQPKNCKGDSEANRDGSGTEEIH